jgi:hypothetical protein
VDLVAQQPGRMGASGRRADGSTKLATATTGTIPDGAHYDTILVTVDGGAYQWSSVTGTNGATLDLRDLYDGFLRMEGINGISRGTWRLYSSPHVTGTFRMTRN